MPKPKRRVYVPNDWRHTATDAEEFGELVYLTRGPVGRAQVRANAKRIAEGLEGSQPHDWLVVGSLSVLTGLAMAAFAAQHGRLNLLVWDQGRYTAHRVSSV